MSETNPIVRCSACGSSKGWSGPVYRRGDELNSEGIVYTCRVCAYTMLDIMHEQRSHETPLIFEAQPDYTPPPAWLWYLMCSLAVMGWFTAIAVYLKVAYQ